MKMHKSLSLIICTLFFTATFAQKNFWKEAEKKFNNYEYYAAIELYKAAYKQVKKPQKPECLWKIGECYRLINDVKQAELNYEKAIKAKCKQEALATLYLADMKKQQEKYPEALAEYEKYKKLVPSSKKGALGVQSCEKAQNWKDNPTRYKVENVVQLNTKEWDFCPMYLDRKKYTTLIISSTREGATGDKDPNVGQLYADLFTTTVDKNGKWSTPVPLSGPLSTKVNEAACVLDEKGSNMYFTKCDVVKKKNPKCQLFGTVKRGQAWEEPVRLNFCIDSFNYGHPALSKDEQILIFSSDLKDSLDPGYGGLDLYYCIYDKKKKEWSKPKNMGPEINTDEDEAFPFLHYDGTLYFASKGHVGMGGFDIFKAASGGTNKWVKPTNMQYPINSAGDDFAIVFETEHERGYFTSNRAGGKGGDDIYSFVLPPLLYSVEGFVKECTSGNPIPCATVKLVGSDNSSYEVKTDAKGFYKFEIKDANSRYVNANTSYVISSQAMDCKNPPEAPKGYLGNPKEKFTTVKVDVSTVFKQDFCLNRIKDEMRLPLILFLLDSADLSHPSNPKDSLEYLVKVLNENPNVTVELAAHTDYRSDAVYNQKLSFRRAKTCVDYLITSRGIDPNRITPAGYGESRPAKTPDGEKDSAIVVPSGKKIPKGTILTEKWIDKNFPKSKNKDDYEAVMQINRRVVFSIKSMNYVAPAGSNAPKTAPEIKVTGSTSEGGDGGESEAMPSPGATTPVEPQVTPSAAPTQTTTPTAPAKEDPKNKKKPK